LDESRSSEQRVVDVIGDVECKQPVVGAVLEQAEDRHGRMGEPVHEQSFQKSLGIVQRPASSRNAATTFSLVLYRLWSGWMGMNELSEEF
jgi:hypothetical protein